MKQIIQKTEGLKKIADFIRDNDGFILICHIAPDGDTLGSALALYSVMKLYGKRVQVVCQDRVPYSLMFLPGAREVITPEKATREDNVIAVDCADMTRLGKAASLFESAKNTISIDHHGTNTMFAMHNEVHPRCAATGEIIYELINIFSGTATVETASCLYTALMTDTGCFAFNNVTSDTFSTAAELVRHGVDSAKINMFVYKTVPVQKSKLLGYALSSTELFCGGKVGFCTISQLDLAKFKARAEDTEGIIDHIRDIETVEIAIFARECLDGEYKVSLRSKEYADVAQLARDFGGGGHIHAAGFKVPMALDKLCDAVVDAAKNALEQTDGE